EGRRRHHCDPFPGRHVGRYVVRRTPLGWEGEPWKSEGGNFSFCSSCSFCRWPQLFGCSGTELNLNWFAPSRKYCSFVVYAAMPDVFSPYWCVQVETVRHKRQWPITLFVYLSRTSATGPWPG